MRLFKIKALNILAFLCEDPLKWKHFVSVPPCVSPHLLHFHINHLQSARTHTDIDRNKNSLLNCQYFISAPCGQAAVMYGGLSMRRRLGNISSAGESLWFIICRGLIARQANGQGKRKKNVWFTSIELAVIYSYIKSRHPFCVVASGKIKRPPFNLQNDAVSCSRAKTCN